MDVTKIKRLSEEASWLMKIQKSALLRYNLKECSFMLFQTKRTSILLVPKLFRSQEEKLSLTLKRKSKDALTNTFIS